MIALKLFYMDQLPDWSAEGDTIEKGLSNFQEIRRYRMNQTTLHFVESIFVHSSTKINSHGPHSRGCRPFLCDHFLHCINVYN